MTLTLDVPAELESRLRERAGRDGVPFESLAADAFARGLADMETEAAQDAEDAEEARAILAQTRPEDRIAWEKVKEIRAQRASDSASREAAGREAA